MQSLSVGLVNWNGGDKLLHTLEAVQCALSEWPAAQVIVVDNASTDGSADEIERRFVNVQVIRNATNLGFGAANNLGFALAQGKYVLVLNPDVNLPQESLKALVQFLDAHPMAGACGPVVLEEDHDLRTISPWCARRDPRPLDIFFEYAYLYRLFPRHRLFARYVMGSWDHSTDRQVDALTGACMLVRREVIEQTGGFDERYFMYDEDLDWCRRIRRAGWQVWFVSEASVRHAGGHSTRQTGDRGVRWSIESHLRYFRKWGSPFDLLKVRIALSSGSLIRSGAWLIIAWMRPAQFRYGLRRTADYLHCAWLAWSA